METKSNITDKIQEYYKQCKSLSDEVKKETKDKAKKLSKDIIFSFMLTNSKSYKSINDLPKKQKDKILSLAENFRNEIYDDIYKYIKKSIDISIALNDDLGWEYVSLTDNGIKEYMERVYGDKTTKQRININTNRFIKVVETYLISEILSTSLKNTDKIVDDIQRKIWNNISSPYTVSFIPKDKIRHYGRGYATNGLSQLYVVEQQMILGMFNESNYNSWKRLPNFKGWRTIVTSRNPCQYCIDEQYITHINKPRLPFHAHCLCILYPIFSKHK